MQLSAIPGIGEKTLSTLKRGNITQVEELLAYYPRTYRTYRATTAQEAGVGEWVSLVGTITRPISKHGAHVTTQLSTFKDQVGSSLTLRWFNMPYITRSVSSTDTYLVRGQLTIFGNIRQIVSPQLTKLASTSSLLKSDLIMPIYPSLGYLKSGNLRKIISSALALTPPIPDPLDATIRQANQLIDLDTAIHTIHAPPTRTDLEGAIRRLAFDELYTLQIENLHNSEFNKRQTAPLNCDTVALWHWLDNLPFTPTNAQNRVIKEILSDLKQPIAMHRLLAGEVGSGKTLVAAASALATHLCGHQTIVMAPTQILAEQLHTSFSDLLGHTLSTSLITAGVKGDPKANLVVGTQALLSPKYQSSQTNKGFGKVGLVIVDEQHKFGVKQRQWLADLVPAPHLLMMTATPIPRTLAMTIFSGLQISRLDELPQNRLPIKTYLVGDDKRDRAYSWIKSEVINHQNQVFVVVPLIEETEDNDNPKKSLKLLETQLKQRFPGLSIDIMHGKMKESDKTLRLQAFRDGITQILVATSMVEVGLDIPGANIMVIEDSDRFGLAQLHQLRGRVGRGNRQGYCLLFVGAKPNSPAYQRVKYFQHESNGEKLALYDLDHRGPGELYGQSQHGFINLRFASIYDTQLLEQTYKSALSTLKKTSV